MGEAMKGLTRIITRNVDGDHEDVTHVDPTMLNWAREPIVHGNMWTIDLAGTRMHLNEEDARRLIRDFGDPDPELYDDHDLQKEFEEVEARMLRLAKEIERRRS